MAQHPRLERLHTESTFCHWRCCGATVSQGGARRALRGLSTAHPAKFSHAVGISLEKEEGFQFEDVLPTQFVGLMDLPRRVIHVQKTSGLEGIRKIITDEVKKELDRMHR